MTDQQIKLQALQMLKTFFGYQRFYPQQWQAINHVMHGHDAVVLMPTGGGKSMCYQIPALISQGCVIVVSPLLALMKDQVDALRANDIPAAAVNSQQSDTDNRTIIEHVYNGRIKLLYISPEKLLAEMETWSQHLQVSLIAIDEAHCISQWGHDFRPEYTRLGEVKQRFPQVPIMALTATADRLTREDIRHQLHIDDATIFETSFDRPNITLNVVAESTARQKLSRIVRFLKRHQGQSGIIYCLSRKTTETVAQQLCKLGYNAQPFHAMLPTQRKMTVQRDFVNDDLPIICATVAFGMGINKSNVRWIIHYNMPQNIERYYQEIGRAGRDGMPAEALMFYSFNDVATLTSFAQQSGQARVNMEKLHRMQQFCESTVCRRRILLNYFDETFDHDCHNCDVCSDPPERFDGTMLAQMALSAIKRVEQREGMTMIVDILKGSSKAELTLAGYHRLKTYGVGRDLTFRQWNAYMLQMLQMGLFYIAYEEGSHLKLTEYGTRVLYDKTGQERVMLSKYDPHAFESRQAAQARQKTIVPSAELVDKQLFEELRLTRTALARAQGIAPYLIFSDKVLTVMAQQRPTTFAEFAILFGVGETKAKRYWRPFTDTIRRYLNSN
ncbi:MAG: DNA helicase RecQ [Muribaculaceae bacterium]|nr:DNA helicase RecQ [Muribaculaceae bacterium]